MKLVRETATKSHWRAFNKGMGLEDEGERDKRMQKKQQQQQQAKEENFYDFAVIGIWIRFSRVE